MGLTADVETCDDDTSVAIVLLERRRPSLPDDGVALVAHGGAGAGGDVLGPLHQGVQVLGVGLGGGPLRTLGGRLRDLAKRGRRAG